MRWGVVTSSCAGILSEDLDAVDATFPALLSFLSKPSARIKLIKFRKLVYQCEPDITVVYCMNAMFKLLVCDTCDYIAILFISALFSITLIIEHGVSYLPHSKV